MVIQRVPAKYRFEKLRLEMMTPQDYSRVVELFQQASELSPEGREAFLARLCTGDNELRREVDEMLAADRSASEFLEAPPDDFAAAVLSAAHTDEAGRWVPSTLGHYRLVRIVGKGGMGVVYEAEQDHPKRIVALKVIKPGLVTPELLRRFERESEVLARLHHPAIAQVHDVGASDTGFGPQPYFGR